MTEDPEHQRRRRAHRQPNIEPGLHHQGLMVCPYCGSLDLSPYLGEDEGDMSRCGSCGLYVYPEAKLSTQT